MPVAAMYTRKAHSTPNQSRTGNGRWDRLRWPKAYTRIRQWGGRGIYRSQNAPAAGHAFPHDGNGTPMVPPVRWMDRWYLRSPHRRSQGSCRCQPFQTALWCVTLIVLGRIPPARGQAAIGHIGAQAAIRIDGKTTRAPGPDSRRCRSPDRYRAQKAGYRWVDSDGVGLGARCLICVLRIQLGVGADARIRPRYCRRDLRHTGPRRWEKSLRLPGCVPPEG